MPIAARPSFQPTLLRAETASRRRSFVGHPVQQRAFHMGYRRGVSRPLVSRTWVYRDGVNWWEWVFSGVGGAAALGVIGLIAKRLVPRTGNEGAHQQLESGAHSQNFQAGRDISIGGDDDGSSSKA